MEVLKWTHPAIVACVTITIRSIMNYCNCKTNITPVWRRYTLTVEEAAGYYHIGENKLRSLIDEHPHENFYVMNGNRVLIKRAKFEEYLDQATAV